MYTRVMVLTTAALILAHGIVGARAQERMTPPPGQQQTQSQGASMMGHGMMGGDMMGRGMMGDAMGHPIMMRLMFALMDADGDGTISLQEFQAAHERIFKAMDRNKDGKLTMEEIQEFMHGSR